MTPRHNPFPGMNPYFEESWGDVHASLIIYVREQLQERLPDDLIARAEEGVAIDAEDSESRGWRPDVKVYEPLAEPQPPAYGDTAVATPLLIATEEIPDRWIEVREASGRLITTLEILSPANKSGPGRSAFLAKRQGHLRAGVSFVEIDLLRDGQWLIEPDARKALTAQGKPAHYLITVFRASCLGLREAYPLSLREPLPAFRIPLRPRDDDVLLELQPIIDRIYVAGRYWFTDIRREPAPPLNEDDARWLDQTLRSAGLRP